MRKSDSISELAKALAKCQSELKAAKFNAINPFLKNKYADLGAVIDAARQPMTSNGLAVSQPVEIVGDIVGVTTILMHVSGEWIESHAEMTLGEERGKSAAQVAGSIVTYLRRYSLASIIGIYADEDTDGNNSQPKREDKTTYPTQEERLTTTSPARTDAQPPAQPAAMTIGEAMNEPASDGTIYGSKETPDLVNRLNAMRKAIGSDKEKPEHARKMLAIQTILNERKGK